MSEVHEGFGEAHRFGPTMKWLIIRHGYYWPTITTNFYCYAKGCGECQRFGPLQKTSIDEMHAVIKPWQFRGWAMDVIRKIEQ